MRRLQWQGLVEHFQIGRAESGHPSRPRDRIRRQPVGRMKRAGLCVAVIIGLLLIVASQAVATETGPVWKVLSVSTPTNFKPGDRTGDNSFLVTATNVGGEPTDGTITLSDLLPEGLTAYKIFGDDAYKTPVREGEASQGGGDTTCSTSPVPHCTTSEPVDPGDTLLLHVSVEVASGLPPSVPNGAMVSGGGAASVSVSNPVTISSALPEYGVAPGGLMAATSTNQAGAHPNVTADFFLNTIDLGTLATPVGTPKDVSFDLPPGLVGTTVGMARCTMAKVVNESHCPADTMVGAATVIIEAEGGGWKLTLPVFNIAPAPGEPAAFAFNALFFPARLDTSVLSNGDYGVRVTARISPRAPRPLRPRSRSGGFRPTTTAPGPIARPAISARATSATPYLTRKMKLNLAARAPKNRGWRC